MDVKDEELVPGVELLTSMRSVGYDFGAAVADLIDNSITAGATRVEVVGDPIEASYVTVLDDGAGMDEQSIRQALRLAGSVGDGTRAEDDLGRFGLGLKTASLSQGRQLTVASLHGGVLNALQWDIDHVRGTGRWTVRVLGEADIAELPSVDALESMVQGTLVVWRRLDVMLAGEVDLPKAMAAHLTALRHHLALTFHRFLEGEGGRPLAITVNGVAVQPVDPFLTRNRATQSSPTEVIRIEGLPVEIKAFTLPHVSKLTATERRRPDLGAGMREAQGFYIYRNKRLISHGTWAGLARRAELSKQSRVRVDFPNALDHLWRLDIKKSRAEAPAVLKRRLADVMTSITGSSERVHTFRARKDPQLDPMQRLWSRQNGRDGYWYEVNLSHPTVRALAEDLDETQRGLLNDLLEDLAGGFPVEDLYASVAKSEHPRPLNLDADSVDERLTALRAAAVLPDEPKAAAMALKNIEPFDSVEDLEGRVANIWSES